MTPPASDRARPLVVGVGHPGRRDDAVGLVAARAAGHRFGGRIRVRECPGDPVGLLDRWADEPAVYLLDASRSGSAPGTVRAIAIGTDADPVDGPATSTHGLSVAETIRLGRALHRLPAQLTLLAVEAGDVSPGEGLTPPVAGAVVRVVETLAVLLGPPDGARSAGGATSRA